MTVWPSFVCEACTVRAFLGRELQDDPRDWSLIRLERMRILDMVHRWARSTHTQYQTQLRTIRRFEHAFGISVLRPTLLTSPPMSDAIPLMWLQEWESVRPLRHRPAQPKAFSSIRAIRAAAAQYYAWDRMVSDPTQFSLDSQARPQGEVHVLPTNELGYSYLAAGMSSRLGITPRPAAALLENHVRWMDRHFDLLYSSATTPEARWAAACAATVNVCAWLSWARASELFSLRWCDIVVTNPSDGPLLGLPRGIGCIQLRLLPATKSNRTSRADIVIAYQCASGLSLGRWLTRLMACHPSAPVHSCLPVFATPPLGSWTSAHFRRHYLWPLLYRQRQEGDPYLAPAAASPADSLETRFWSMHCYRRGGRTHVSRPSPGRRRATALEISEHGRWKRKQSSLDMPSHYLELPVCDRISLTLCCM